MTDKNRDDIIELAMQRLIDGEDLDAILRDYPGHAAELHDALSPAVTLLAVPIPPPSPAARLSAQHRLTNELRAQQARTPRAIGVVAWMAAMRARPVAFQALAGVAAFAVFGGVGIGAAAATGNTPQPIRSILRISSDSATRVQYRGVVADIETLTHSMTIALADGSVRTITITSSTQLSGAQGAIAFDALRPGDVVDVTAVQREDGSVTATRIAVSPPAATAAAGETPDARPGTDGGTATSGTGAGGEHGSAGDQPSSHESPEASIEVSETPGARGTHTPETEDGTPASDATGPAGSEDGTPESTHAAGGTEAPEPTHGTPGTAHTPEPTEKPEATQPPEPTEPPETEQSAPTPTPQSAGG